MNELLEFKISAGLKNIIGKELITNKYIAIFELVKNSYDALSKNIEIRFTNNEITIIDDGRGMSKSDILNNWLFVAYSNKLNKTAEDGRKFVGAKGIGRFACDRVAKNTTIITKTSSDIIEHSLEVDWTKFEESLDNEFQSIKVKYSFSEVNNPSSYTIIKLTNLNDNWDEDDLKELEKLLKKFVDPFDTKYSLNIFLNYFNSKHKIENNIVETIKKRSTSITVKFEDIINIELIDRDQIIYKIHGIENLTCLKGIEINLNYLNKPAKGIFTTIMGTQPVNYGTIFVYKNGFRVHPIGEPGNDYFGIDSRKTQGFNRYLGGRELFGVISINDDKSNFIEVSSRDGGFIDNIYVRELKNLYLEYAHKPLEKYVNAIRFGFDMKTQTEVTINDIIFNENDIIPKIFKSIAKDNIYINPLLIQKIKPSLNNKINRVLNNNDVNREDYIEIIQEAKNLINNKNKEIVQKEKELSNVKKDNVSLQKTNKILKQLTREDNIKQAEITHHMSKYSNTIDSIINNLNNNLSKDVFYSPNIIKQMAILKNIAIKLKVFNKIILHSDIEAKNKSRFNIYEYFDFYINDVSEIDKSMNVNLFINQNNTSIADWIFYSDPYDLSIIIDNMYSNARDLKAKYFEIRFDCKNNKHIIEFFSDTAHIDDYSKIFELGYSTKEKGTGIGLYNIKQIINRSNWDISVENVSDGVVFRIYLKE